MRKMTIYGSPYLRLFVLLVASASTTVNAQNYSVLYNFGTAPGDPLSPEGPNIIAQGRDGNLYSTTPYGGAGTCGGGASGCGAIFKITPTGKLTTIYSFNASGDGYFPYSGLTLGTDGNLYGTTTGTIGSCTGNTNDANGTIFRVTPDGALTTLYVFTGGADGGSPQAPPVQASDGNFYGTTTECGTGRGTFYKITPSGIFSKLRNFYKRQPCGGSENPVVQGTDGSFYLAATLGGVCKVPLTGKVTVLANLPGSAPRGPLVQGSDGSLYGTTTLGGTFVQGSVFKITTDGQFTTLYSLNGTTDGVAPIGGLLLATDGKFYGTAAQGGGHDAGTIFEISPTATFKVLYDFEFTTGRSPQVTLLQHTNGLLYGDTFCGGTGHGGQCNSGGVFYSWNANFGPFITFLPAQGSGKIGTSVGILGQNLTGTSAVAFGGVPATFTVSSDTFLTATVPTGALTGAITVTTSGGTLTSNKNFRVTPVIKKFTPTSGPVGTTVVIMGVSLMQTTQVSFGGVPATNFTVNSDTQVTALVPTGALTGKIEITTAGGIAKSPAKFTVI